MSTRHLKARRRWSFLTAGLVVGLALHSAATMSVRELPAAVAAVEHAQDGRFALADAHIEKAIALLKAAQNPTAKNAARPFGGHRTRAVASLERAREQIAAAQAYAVQSE